MTSAEQELIPLYHRWMEAIQQKDMVTLEQILGEEYTYTASNQGRWSRQGWLDQVAIYNIQSFEFPSIEVRTYGEAAVALVQCKQVAIYAGAQRSGEFLITDAWVHRDGRWQVVARSSILAAAQN
jgi:hypothetical protein